MTKFALVFTFLLFTSLSANAEGVSAWSNATGELQADAHNPWFFNNTREVSYCIEIDEQNFGATSPAIREQITRALQFWNTEFSKVSLPSLPTFGGVQIASQNFQEAPCSETTDVRFQFGTLDEKQTAFLGKPQDIAAITIRTDYSTKDLRGKGFLYFSPAHGPLAYKADGYLQNTWSRENNELLYRALVHELGHVFGLSHMGSYGELMSEGYIESLLNQSIAMEGKLRLRGLNFFTLVKTSPTICPDATLLKDWRQFFGLGANDKCVQFRFVHDPGNELFAPSQLEIWASSHIAQVKQRVSVAELTVNRFSPIYLNLIDLPAEQEVFVKQELQEAGLGVFGVPMMGLTKRGNFIFEDGKIKRHINVRFDQGSSAFYIDGVSSEGEIITLL